MVVLSSAGVLLLFGVEREYEILVAAVPILRLFRMDFVGDEAAEDIILMVGQSFDDDEAERMSL